MWMFTFTVISIWGSSSSLEAKPTSFKILYKLYCIGNLDWELAVSIGVNAAKKSIDVVFNAKRFSLNQDVIVAIQLFDVRDNISNKMYVE